MCFNATDCIWLDLLASLPALMMWLTEMQIFISVHHYREVLFPLTSSLATSHYR